MISITRSSRVLSRRSSEGGRVLGGRRFYPIYLIVIRSCIRHTITTIIKVNVISPSILVRNHHHSRSSPHISLVEDTPEGDHVLEPRLRRAHSRRPVRS